MVAKWKQYPPGMDLGEYDNHGTSLQQRYKSSVLRALQSAVLYVNLHERNVLNIIIIIFRTLGSQKNDLRATSPFLLHVESPVDTDKLRQQELQACVHNLRQPLQMTWEN